MAKKLRNFNFALSGVKHRYPWDTWLDGSIYELTHGEDFHSKPVSFRQHVYSVAAKRGVRARISDRGDGVFVIQAVEK